MQQTKSRRRHALPRRPGTGRATSSRSFILSFGDAALPASAPTASHVELSPPVAKPLQDIANVVDEAPHAPEPGMMLKPVNVRRREHAGSGRLTSKRSYNLDTGSLAAAYFAAEEAKRQAAEAAARAAAEALARAEAAAKRAEEEAAALAAAIEAEKARRAEEAARAEAAAAAAQEIAAQAVAAAIAAQVAATPVSVRAAAGLTPIAAAAGPGATTSTSSSFPLMTPVEGVPELRSLLRARQAALAAAAVAAAQPTPVPAVAFTPVEGVPETARGFRGPQVPGGTTAAKAAAAGTGRRPVPKFTPVEGVPERGLGSAFLQLLRTPFEQRLERGAAAAGQPQEPSLVSDAATTPAGVAAAAGLGLSTTPAAAAGLCHASIQADMDIEEQEAAAALAPPDYDDGGDDYDFGGYEEPAEPEGEAPGGQQQLEGEGVQQEEAAGAVPVGNVALPARPTRGQAVKAQARGQQQQQPQPLRVTPRSAGRHASKAAGSANAADLASPEEVDMAAAQQSVSELVAGLASGSPLTPLHPTQLQMDSRGTPATAGNRQAAAARRTAAASGAAAAASAAGGAAAGSSGDQQVASSCAGDTVGDLPAAAEDADHLTRPQQQLGGRLSMPAPQNRRMSVADPATAAVAMAAVAAAAAAAFKDPEAEGGAAGGRGGARSGAARRGSTAVAGSRPPVNRQAHTPYEGRMAKQRKSLAGDGLVLDEEGKRRSQRARRTPLEYWRNEKVEYGRDHKSLPTVVGVTKRTPDPQWPLPSTKAARSKARTHPGGTQGQQHQADKEEEEQQEQQARSGGSGSSGGRSKQRQVASEGEPARQQAAAAAAGERPGKARSKQQQQQQQGGARSKSR